MSQVSYKARKEFQELKYDRGTKVQIPGTKKKVTLKGIKPYTIEVLTNLWLERDATLPKNAPDTLKSLCVEPYFAVKEACIMVLNDWLALRIIYPLMWRVWAYFRGYTEEQMMPIIQEGKKKLQLSAHWMNMAFSVDMREDWMKMTAKEAEQYRAELLSEVNALSLKNSPNTGDGNGA